MAAPPRAAPVDNGIEPSLFGRVLHIEFSKHPLTSNAKGVAIVLNKNMVKTGIVKKREIIPGRAMLTEMEHVDGSTLSLLGIYAPNAPAENATFWTTIKRWFETHPTVKRPDVMGGDFNMVEDPIDRLPARQENNGPVNTLDELKTYLRLVDGWRDTFPTTRAYTYHQSEAQGGAQSRIDRIYVRRPILEHTFEWDIQTVGLDTDHRMVSVKLTTENAPSMGHGRWVWPAHLMSDKVLTTHIQEAGMKLQNELERIQTAPERDGDQNAQRAWMDFKKDIGTKARERAKIVIPKLAREIAELDTKLKLYYTERDTRVLGPRRKSATDWKAR
ncbi:hypothetical protein B0H15DRAFT_919002 [Mycena belliarum]|uniref:DNase I-like protein n=1 Tax=Mycena belliarum TaxID=1033014 RepID=A0AAD6UJW1_9AGAR|nr:hypothetical protein B0H15DRAFT_919002 [Mycena belliae]